MAMPGVRVCSARTAEMTVGGKRPCDPSRLPSKCQGAPGPQQMGSPVLTFAFSCRNSLAKAFKPFICSCRSGGTIFLTVRNQGVGCPVGSPSPLPAPATVKPPQRAGQITVSRCLPQRPRRAGGKSSPYDTH